VPTHQHRRVAPVGLTRHVADRPRAPGHPARLCIRPAARRRSVSRRNHYARRRRSSTWRPAGGPLVCPLDGPLTGRLAALSRRLLRPADLELSSSRATDSPTPRRAVGGGAKPTVRLPGPPTPLRLGEGPCEFVVVERGGGVRRRRVGLRSWRGRLLLGGLRARGFARRCGGLFAGELDGGPRVRGAARARRRRVRAGKVPTEARDRTAAVTDRAGRRGLGRHRARSYTDGPGGRAAGSGWRSAAARCACRSSPGRGPPSPARSRPCSPRRRRPGRRALTVRQVEV
jgi:hypothetical protein